jgi:hypothetical protein
LRAHFGGLGLFELEAIGLGFDDEQRSPLFDRVAVLVLNLL